MGSSPTGGTCARGRQCTTFTLNVGSTLLQRAIEKNLQRNAGITQVQFELLMQLAGRPEGLRMSELADRLIVSRSGLSYQVSQLEKHGLIIRERHSIDERGVVARITDAGEALRARIAPEHVALVRRHFFDKLSRDDLATITAAFRRIADGLAEEAG